MSWMANGDGDYLDLETLHSNAASSLMRMADSALYDLEGRTPEKLFEKSYLQSLEEATVNKNFDRDVLENLIDAGRQLHRISQEYDEDEYVGIGGELGDEKFYKLTEEQYQEGVESFEFDEYEVGEWFAPDALNDIESELLIRSCVSFYR